jgi:hypothetical protein
VKSFEEGRKKKKLRGYHLFGNVKFLGLCISLRKRALPKNRLIKIITTREADFIPACFEINSRNEN